MELFRRNSQRVKPAGCFRRGALSLMLDKILNVTLSEELTTTGVSRRNLELPLPPHLLIHIKHKSNKMKSWMDPTSSFPLRRTHPLGR